MALKIPATKEDFKLEGEPGTCVLLRSLFTLQQRYQTIANPPPGVVEGQVVCEEGGGEGGLKGHVLQRATGLGMLTVVKVNEPHCRSVVPSSANTWTLACWPPLFTEFFKQEC